MVLQMGNKRDTRYPIHELPQVVEPLGPKYIPRHWRKIWEAIQPDALLVLWHLNNG